MKIGMVVPPLGTIALVETILAAAEQLGFDSAWLPDHLTGMIHPDIWAESAPPVSSPMAPGPPDPDAWLDPFVVAAVLGRQSDLPIGTCVTDSARRRAADLARTALTLHHNSRGGFMLGIGAGEAMSTLPFGYEFKRPVGVLEETLIELRSLFDTGRMPDGVGRIVIDGPADPPEIWVAANGPRILKLTGRYADGWLPVATTSPEVFADQYATVCSAAEAADRPKPTAGYVPSVLLGRSREHVAGVLEQNPLAKLVLLNAPAAVWHRHGLEHPGGPACRGYTDLIVHELDPDELRRVAPRIPIEMVEEFVILGNADELAARLRSFVEIGARHFALIDLSGFCYQAEETADLMPELGRLVLMLREHEPQAIPT